MARIFIEGFEAGDLMLWNYISSGSIVLATGVPGMSGTYCLHVNGSDIYIHKDLPAKDELYLAFKYRPTAGNSRMLFHFFNGTNALGFLRRRRSEDGGATNALEAGRGSHESGTVLATSSTPIAIDNVYLIEIRYKPHDSTGVFQVKVNGVMEIDFSGDTTDYAGQVNRIRIGATSNWAQNYDFFDDLVLDDANWIGETKIQAIVPTGAGSSTQFTPSAGANYECVDEVPASETDYNQTETDGHLDLFAAGNLAGSIGAVKCVQVQARGKLIDSPIPNKLQLAVRSGGANYFGASQALTNIASKVVAQLWENDPATASPWTESGVNAAEIGYKAVST